MSANAKGENWSDLARRFTDAVFGKDNASRGLRSEDPFDLYDWLLKAHANLTQEQVNGFFDQNPTDARFRGLPLKDARVRISREHTKWMWIRSQQDKTVQVAEAEEQKPAHGDTVVSNLESGGS